MVSVNVPDLQRKAESGNCAARCILGFSYLYGLHAEVDYKKAFDLLSTASKQGASRAVVHLAWMYAEGLGTAKNINEAIRLYKAVAKVEFMAPVHLARLYAVGKDVPADPSEALKWYSSAASWEGTIEDCDDLQEAKGYVAKFSKP